MSNLKVTTINDKDGGSNAVLYGVAAPTGSMGFRNRILNGDCRIDQRNAGASVTPSSASYLVDRWVFNFTQASKFSFQQNAGSVTPPAGFTNYLGATVVSAVSIGAGDVFVLRQRIEGFNVADLSWGTANAQAVTLSFWVRSSLTGTFGGSFQNNAENRAYPFTYTISAANTWEQKTITVAGDTTGTWLTNNSTGIMLGFSLGTGATSSGTAGAWAASGAISASGATSVVGTNGATFYITGVQLEAGSVASPFERRDYGRELMMCQRYFQRNTQTFNTNCLSTSDINARVTMRYPVAMRAAPTITGTASLGSFFAENISDQQATYATLSVGAGGYGTVTGFSQSSEL